VCNKWILVAVRTTIIALFYFSPIFNILHLNRQQTKVVSFSLSILLHCSLKIESLSNFRKQMCGVPATKALCAFKEGVSSRTPFHGPLPVSRNLDPPLVFVIMHFQIKSLKKVYWWHFALWYYRFQRRYIDFEGKNLLSRFGPREVMVSVSYNSLVDNNNLFILIIDGLKFQMLHPRFWEPAMQWI